MVSFSLESVYLESGFNNLDGINIGSNIFQVIQPYLPRLLIRVISVA